MANPPESLSSKFDAVTAQLIELNSKVATLFAPPVLTVSLTTSLTAALTTVLKTPVLTVSLTTAFTTALAATRAVSPPRAVSSPAALNSVSPLPPAALNSVSPLPPAIDLVSVALVELTKAALDLDAAMKAAASPTATAADKAAVTVATTALAAATTAVRTAATPAPQPLDLVSNALGDVTTAVAATAAAALTTQISAVLPAELTAALESLTKAAEAAAAATAAVGSASPTQMPGAMAALTAAAEAAATATAAATAETAVFTANMSAAYSTIIPSLDQVTNSLVDVTAAAAKLKEGTAALAAEQAAAAAAAAVAAAAPAAPAVTGTLTRKQEEAFKSMMGQIQSYVPNFMAVANSLDNIQRRALASNTTLFEVSRLASKDLGVLVTDLSAEILSLRESGIRELNDSTISLIARMKRTDQSTAALGVFLSLNSAKLAINSTEAQKLAVSMLESARKYGVSESKALETANDTSQHLGLLATLNLAKNAQQGATNYKISMGNKAGINEDVNKLLDLLSSGDATRQAMFGIQREVQEFTKGTPDQTEEAIRSSVRKIDSFIQGQIGPNKDPITASILIENFGGADFTNAMRALATQSKLTPSVSDVDTVDSLKAFTTEIRALIEMGIQPFYLILKSITGFLQNFPIIKQFTAVILVTGSIIFAGYQLITAFSLLHKLVALTNIQLGRNLALGSAQQAGAMGNAAASTWSAAGFLGKLSGPLMIAVLGLQAASLILNKQQQIRDHTKESMIEMKQKLAQQEKDKQETMSPLSQILRRQVRQALDNQTAEDDKSMITQNSLLEQIRDAVRVKERIPVSKQTGRSSR